MCPPALKHTIAVLFTAGAASALLYPAALPAQTGVYVVAASDYVVQGVSQTLGESSLQAGAGYRHRSGVFAGVWVAENTLLKNDNNNGGNLREVDYYAGWQTTAAGGTWTATLTHYGYPGERYYSDYRYNELAVSWRGGQGLSATVGVTDNFRNYDRHSGFLEFAWERALSENLVFNAGLGYHDTERLFGRGYGYTNAGLTWLAGRFAVDLSYIDTTSGAAVIFGDEAAGSRWMLSVVAEVF